MADFTVKDSGDKREFSTGSVRDRKREGKGRYDLIPTYPLFRLARRYEEGCRYGERNWELGQPLMASYIDSGFRHLSQFIAGDQSEDHPLRAVGTCLLTCTPSERLRRVAFPPVSTIVPSA
jgi:hypothetical protein